MTRISEEEVPLGESEFIQHLLHVRKWLELQLDLRRFLFRFFDLPIEEALGGPQGKAREVVPRCALPFRPPRRDSLAGRTYVR